MKSLKMLLVLVIAVFVSGGCGSEMADELQPTAEAVIETTAVVSEVSTTAETSEPTTVATTLDPAVQALYDRRQVAEAYLAAMTVEEKVGQLFYVSLPTYSTGAIPAGGVIFFKPDLNGRDAHQKTIKILRSADLQPFIGIDEEGGIISRLSSGDYGVPKLPSPWDQAHSGQEGLVGDNSRMLAEALENIGYTMNFAPVADIHTNPDNPVIGHRAYSDSPDDVAKYVLESLSGYEETSVIPVVKHFPGHGDTFGDSHQESVYIEGDLADLKARELVPFQAAVDTGVDVVMMGHIRTPDVTVDDLPASLSHVMIRDVLREEMGFDGLVISDSLIMKGITDSYTYEEVLEMGLTAGLDMFLIPEAPEAGFMYLVDEVQKDDEMADLVDEAVIRILMLKLKYDLIDLDS